MKIYGKTGSTENPEHAWFECFAEDNAGRLIIVVALVEGGSRGSDDAAPLGHGILKLCSDAGYIGTRTASPVSVTDLRR
jgi:cell division protein FtsI/penicillin-binding protein 2